MIQTKELEREDLEAVARLEQEIFPDAWSVKGLEETFAQKQALILGAWIEEALAGYVIFYHVLDEGEIARIAAAPCAGIKGWDLPFLENWKNAAAILEWSGSFWKSGKEMRRPAVSM